MKDRNFDRFAILLIDNVVELTLHRYAKDQQVLEQSGSSSCDPKKMRKALGNYFGDKVDFAEKQELINQNTSKSIQKLHDFRNTSYHQGLRHEGVLHSLAIFYFRNTCTLLKAYKPPFWMWNGSDKISHRAMKYLGTLSSGNPSDYFMAAYERLDAAVIFGQSYYESENSKEITNSTVENPKKSKKTKRDNWLEAESGKEFLEWLISDYNWSVKSDPILGWRSQHKTLKNQTNYHEVLEQYCNFMRNTYNIRLALEESADALDHFIEMESEITRGK